MLPAVPDALLLLRIEDASLNASAPPQQRWLDGWLVRANPGKAKRARCINAVAAGRQTLDGKLAQARRWLSEQGLPLIVRITPFSQPEDLDAQLAARGFTRTDHTCVMVMPDLGTRLSAPPALTADLKWVRLDAAAYAQAVGRLRDTPAPQRQAHAERLAQSPVPYQGRALMRQGDAAVLACGQWAREGDLVGLYDVFTHPAHRQRGLATLLCEHLLSESVAQGAAAAYLQLEADNSAAARLYQRLGFVHGYDYHYRQAPPDAL